MAFSFDPAHPYGAGQHRGIDIGGGAAAPVLAPAAGLVTFAGTVPGSGMSVSDPHPRRLVGDAHPAGVDRGGQGRDGRGRRRRRDDRPERRPGGERPVRPARDPARRSGPGVRRPADAAAAAGASEPGHRKRRRSRRLDVAANPRGARRLGSGRHGRARPGRRRSRARSRSCAGGWCRSGLGRRRRSGRPGRRRSGPGRRNGSGHGRRSGPGRCRRGCSGSRGGHGSGSGRRRRSGFERRSRSGRRRRRRPGRERPRAGPERGGGSRCGSGPGRAGVGRADRRSDGPTGCRTGRSGPGTCRCPRDGVIPPGRRFTLRIGAERRAARQLGRPGRIERGRAIRERAAASGRASSGRGRRVARPVAGCRTPADGRAELDPGACGRTRIAGSPCRRSGSPRSARCRIAAPRPSGVPDGAARRWAQRCRRRTRRGGGCCGAAERAAFACAGPSGRAGPAEGRGAHGPAGRLSRAALARGGGAGARRSGSGSRLPPAGARGGPSYDCSRWQATEDPGGAGVAVCGGAPAPRARRRVRRPSDVFARYHRLRGNDVLMVSGTDEHGTPVMVAADREGKPYGEVADYYNQSFREDFQRLGPLLRPVLAHDDAQPRARHAGPVPDAVRARRDRRARDARLVLPRHRPHAPRPVHRGHVPDLRLPGGARRPVRQLRQPARPDRPDRAALADRRLDAGVPRDEAPVPRPAAVRRPAPRLDLVARRLAAERPELLARPARRDPAAPDHARPRLGRPDPGARATPRTRTSGSTSGSTR